MINLLPVGLSVPFENDVSIDAEKSDFLHSILFAVFAVPWALLAAVLAVFAVLWAAAAFVTPVFAVLWAAAAFVTPVFAVDWAALAAVSSVNPLSFVKLLMLGEFAKEIFPFIPSTLPFQVSPWPLELPMLNL